jgi:hypothetical protein
MTAGLSRLSAHIANWRQWELNPVVIKELRQGVRSWAVTGMLLLFLAVLFVTTAIFLVGQTIDSLGDERLGGTIFSFFMAILTGASILFIPLYVGVRMAAERREGNPDLLYISTLSPSRIIRGKLYFGAYVTLLFISACMPFMALTNLLRGVDLPTVFILLGFLFVVVCSVNQLAIFIACLPVTRLFKMLFSLGGVFLSFWIIGVAVVASNAMMREGLASMFLSKSNLWMVALSNLAIVALFGGLFFTLSVVMISPPSANRALPARVYVTLMWLLGGLLAIVWTWAQREPAFILVWSIPATFLLVASLAVTVSNDDRLSTRVLRTIPGGGLKRALAFLFYNGAAGGICWIGGLVALTYLTSVCVFGLSSGSHSGASTSDITKFLEQYPPALGYVFAYALTGLFIQRRFFPRRAPKFAGCFAIIVCALAVVGPMIVRFFLNELTWASVEKVQLGSVLNIFIMREADHYLGHQLCAGFWLLIAIGINATWFFRQVENFRPPTGNVLPGQGDAA